MDARIKSGHDERVLRSDGGGAFAFNASYCSGDKLTIRRPPSASSRQGLYS
jgi:hypothetical protein